MAGVRAIPSQISVISTVIEECLPEHNRDDRQFVFDQIISLCNLNSPNGLRDFLLDQSKELLAVWIILTTDTVNTGRFALIYHQQLNDIIRRRDSDGFEKLWVNGISNFYELQNNDELTEEEKNKVNQILAMEYESASLALEKSIQDLGNLYQRSFLNIKNKTINLPGNSLSVYGLSYSEVAASRNNYYHYPGMDKIPERINYPSLSPDGSLEMRCMDTMKFIREIADGNFNEASERLSKLYRDKFLIEIKLYKYYLRHLNNDSQ